MSAVREALIVAVDEYADPGLGQLRAPHHDAEALGDVLADPRIGDFTVRVLRNETAQSIRVAVEDFFADRKPDDLLLLHFSCHGLKNAAGELFLAASDSRPARLASTAVAADFVNQQMADSRAQRIALFLDCCYGGAFPRGMVVRSAGIVEVGDAFAAAQEAAGGRGRVVVTASSSVEYAFEGGELAPGAQVTPSVFTGSVVEGLSTGEADRDGDGWVGLHELFTYVAEKVRRATPHQTPHLWAFGSEGDLLLAHSGRRRITADPLPPELMEAVHSSLPATRYGVAVELRDRLFGQNLGQALAAWNVLSDMVDDDSRRVSEFAATAIRQADLLVSPATVELGSSPPGEPRVQELRLSGSPLALVASAHSANDWLRCEVDSDRLQVTVAPDEPGQYEGTVVVATPMGEHQVPVRVDVAPAEAIPKPRSARRKPAPVPVEQAPEAEEPGAAVAAETIPQAREKEEEPQLVEAASEQVGPRRLWWPVSAALLLIAIGWASAYGSIDEYTLWRMPNEANLRRLAFRDGLSLAIVGVIVLVLAALAWPRVAALAVGIAGGVGLFFATFSLFFLAGPTVNSHQDVAGGWFSLGCLGLAAVAVVMVEIWRRHLFRGQQWRRPSTLEICLVVPGAVLVLAATRQSIDSESLWSHGLALLVPVVSVALTCWAGLTRVTSERGEIIVVAAVAYLVTDTMVLLYVAVAASDAPFAGLTVLGNLLLLLALALRLRGHRWPRLNLAGHLGR